MSELQQTEGTPQTFEAKYMEFADRGHVVALAAANLAMSVSRQTEERRVVPDAFVAPEHGAVAGHDFPFSDELIAGGSPEMEAA